MLLFSVIHNFIPPCCETTNLAALTSNKLQLHFSCTPKFLWHISSICSSTCLHFRTTRCSEVIWHCFSLSLLVIGPAPCVLVPYNVRQETAHRHPHRESSYASLLLSLAGRTASIFCSRATSNSPLPDSDAYYFYSSAQFSLWLLPVHICILLLP